MVSTLKESPGGLARIGYGFHIEGRSEWISENRVWTSH